MDHLSRVGCDEIAGAKAPVPKSRFCERFFCFLFLLIKKKRCTDTLQNLLASCSSDNVSGSEKQSINAATNIKNRARTILIERTNV